MANNKSRKQENKSPKEEKHLVVTGSQGIAKSLFGGVGENRLVIIALCVSFVFLAPVLVNEFLSFDDPSYVTSNPLIQGLGFINLKRFFTEQFVGTYQPLVMVGYAIQFKVFGMSASGFHLISLLLHLANIYLVFRLALQLLKKTLAAFITALLFGIHPMHVEAVAWVSSQKDLLYAFFFLSSSLAYLRFRAQKNDLKYYFASLLLFVLSLLSKQQAVVLPVVFLLYDFLQQRNSFSKAIIEKLPFFALSIGFGVLAFIMQQKIGAIQDFSYFPFYERVLFACYGFICYLLQALVPIKLSIFYPYPETLDTINSPFVYIAPFLVVLLAVLLFVWRKKNRILIFAALFFCVTIALVIQLIPVGAAVRADRYTYISLTGIFLFVGSAFANLVEKKPGRQYKFEMMAACYFIILGVLSFNRATVFKDSMTAYNNALENYPSFLIYYNRGVLEYNNGQIQESIDDFAQVEQLKPNYPDIWFTSAMAYQKLNNYPKAIENYNRALENNPKNEEIYIQLQNIHLSQNDLQNAIKDATQIIALRPDRADAYFSRAGLFGRTGKIKEALADLDKAISLKPDFTDAYNNRGIANSMAGNYEAALNDYNKSIALQPNNWNSYYNRSMTLKALGRYGPAYGDAMTAKTNGCDVNDNYLQDLKRLAGK